MSTLHIYMGQLSYIVPIINYLRTCYDDVHYYFICGAASTLSSIILAELVKIQLITENTKIFFITHDDFLSRIMSYDASNNKILIASSNYLKGNDLQKIKEYIIYYNHGVDEECIMAHNKYDSIKNIQHNMKLYDIKYKNIIESIYTIDPSKKTIIFFETTSIWLFKKFSHQHEPFLIEIQKKLFDVLKDLKNKYNIILRFHPQEYTDYITSGNYHCEKCFQDNFIINYQPIPVYNLYECADIIFTSRFSSSGYQAIFVKNKTVVLVDSDFDKRCEQNGYKCEFIKKYKNVDIENKIKDCSVLSPQQTYTIMESQFDSIYDIITDFEMGNSKRFDIQLDEYVKNKYGIDRITM